MSVPAGGTPSTSMAALSAATSPAPSTRRRMTKPWRSKRNRSASVICPSATGAGYDRRETATPGAPPGRVPSGGGRDQNPVMVRYVVFYESADDVAAKAPADFPDHVAWVREFKERGDL